MFDVFPFGDGRIMARSQRKPGYLVSVCRKVPLGTVGLVLATAVGGTHCGLGGRQWLPCYDVIEHDSVARPSPN